MIAQSEYLARREAVLAQMSANSLCILFSASEQTRSNDTEYLFRQNSDFFYLTGFNEPQAALVLIKQADNSTQSILFCRAKDKLAEIWNGRRIGPEAAKELFNLSSAYPVGELATQLVELLNGKTAVYWLQGESQLNDETVFSAILAVRQKGKFASAPTQFFDLRCIIHELRLIKSESELAVMQKAADISCDAHIRAMKSSAAGKYEYQLEADILHEFAYQGARFAAYNSIVAGGDNACILHYTENCDELKAGELVLIDAGCELNGYAADITRTFPVNGRFSKEQAQLYQLVLDAQQAALDSFKPGQTLSAATQIAVNVITQGLIDLGILTGTLEQNTQAQGDNPPAYRQFFMHGLSHWLGIDVHDVGAYKINDQDRPLTPGMVITVEPGLYIAKDIDNVEPKWRGIGIRIEDNIVITESGYTNLTQAAPKTISAIEQLMAG
ncbi:Xaa-Pro aminopeptidase [Catenovulum sp. 2E275]|uniref:Xaa-Pro aminopeptidase n=1 Tax=Catenovulum sp. 2E275 TaxID=2980497 RepID=UPI0021CFD26E|nr:Xaa-Pro aminopeptidase [Catenovulum sp. 2E275]MCU4674322.1 Xaa-Pro aminopeptidase [Catenovulum sp. 2E275]